MKTRVIRTSFWRDTNGVMTVPKDSRLLWVFLLTNEYIGMSNYVYIPPMFIMHHTAMTEEEFFKAREAILATGKVYFFEGWWFIPNLEKKNGYKNSPKNEKSYNAELAAVPENVKGAFMEQMEKFDSTMDTSIDTRLKTKNKNIKLKNKKQKDDSVKKENVDKLGDKFKSSGQVINEIKEGWRKKGVI